MCAREILHGIVNNAPGIEYNLKKINTTSHPQKVNKTSAPVLTGDLGQTARHSLPRVTDVVGLGDSQAAVHMAGGSQGVHCVLTEITTGREEWIKLT